MINPEKLTFKHLIMTIGNLPSSYVESLSYYECLLWLCNYLENTVIPALNNNAEAVEELQTLYVQLKSYVDNYFANLDVQEEINNKLDDMAESGELSELIEQYLTITSVISFDTFNNLKNAENVVDGSTCVIQGYNSYNDGKRCYYKIREILNTDVVDNDKIVALNNFENLIAEKLGTYDIDHNLELHTIYNVSSGYIVKLPNKKVLLVDTGKANEWTEVNAALTNLGITKIDYIILTHFHDDHIGNITNICTNYDTSDATCWVQVKPDYVNHSADIEETEEYYTQCIEELESNGLTPIVPTNDSIVELDDNLTLHFLNTSLENAETYDYYDQQAEWHDTGKINYNLFSLIVELTYGSKRITFTGDIEKAAEHANYNKMHKCDILVAPHHGVNRCAYEPFYELLKPIYTLMEYKTTQGAIVWVRPFFKQFEYLQKYKTTFITMAWSIPTNGLFSFYISENSIFENIKNCGLPIENIVNDAYIKPEVDFFVDFMDQTRDDLTLVELIANMPHASELVTYWYPTYGDTFPQLEADLIALYPNFSDYSLLRITKLGTGTRAKIEIIKSGIKVEYITNGTDIDSAWGEGNLGNHQSTTALITTLSKLPIGKYFVPYFKDTNDAVLESGEFTVDINLVLNTGTRINATCIAYQRLTSGTRQYNICNCYIDTNQTTKYTWINNT